MAVKGERYPAARAHILPTSSRKPSVTEATLLMGGAVARVPLNEEGGIRSLRDQHHQRLPRLVPQISLLFIFTSVFIMSNLPFISLSLAISSQPPSRPIHPVQLRLQRAFIHSFIHKCNSDGCSVIMQYSHRPRQKQLCHLPHNINCCNQHPHFQM